MLFYRSSLPLSRSTLTYLSGVLRRHRKQIGSKGRALTAGQQALMTLAYLKNAETFAQLGAGFKVGTTTAWRYVNEAVGLLSARSPKLGEALRRARKDGLLYVVLDGTLIPIDRVKADRPFYSGKHKKHGMNLQVIADPAGVIVWVSGPLPGSVHDLKAARIWGILRALANAGLIVLADKGYIGAGQHITTPYKGRRKPESQKAANRSHAKLRGPGERANAQLKSWKILTKLRCCPHRAGHLAKAIHVLIAIPGVFAERHEHLLRKVEKPRRQRGPGDCDQSGHGRRRWVAVARPSADRIWFAALSWLVPRHRGRQCFR